MSRSRLVCLLLAIGTMLVYLPVRNHEFVNYDDQGFLTDNPTVQAGLTWTGIRWAFTTFDTGNWQPVTWLSHMLDCHLFGLRAGLHHLVNVAFHTVNACLLFLLLLRLTTVASNTNVTAASNGALWSSATVAALFAWHPMRVESVAWASERKDLLCAFFFLLTIMAYARYARGVSNGGREIKNAGAGESRSFVPKILFLQAEHPGETSRASAFYFLALLLFMLGLMSKPMLVTLPCVLLLLDYWPLQRWPGKESQSRRRLMLEKWPFFALSAVSAAVTSIAQHHAGAMIQMQDYPMRFRLEHAVLGYGEYLVKTVFPANLAIFYPVPRTTSWLAVLASGAALVLISWLVWRERRRKPFWMTGWFWFLGMLVPVIGLVKVGDQFIADRYTYLPSIGLFVGIVFSLAGLIAKRRVKPVLWASVAAVVLAGCLAGTARQLGFWQNTETLFVRALAVTKDNAVVHNNLGGTLLQKGRVDEAMEHFKQALAIDPNYARSKKNLGLCLVRLGRLDEAAACFQQALELDPRSVDALENLATLHLRSGRMDEAMGYLRQARELQPSSSKAFNNLGVEFLQTGRLDEAAKAFQRAVDLQPFNGQARNNLAYVLLQQGRVDEAISHLRMALKNRPQFAKARCLYGVCLLRKGNAAEAVTQFTLALDNQPDYTAAKTNLAWLLATCPDERVRNGERALTLAKQAMEFARGTDPAIAAILAAALAETGDFPEAIITAEQALQLARNRGDTALAAGLEKQLEMYRTGTCWRDPALTNASP
jgi:protein O-mannosyl-transferase